VTGGFTGKILRINLTRKSIGTIDTEQYEEYGGGHGIGSAIFGDLAGDQLPFDALDPRNVVTISLRAGILPTGGPPRRGSRHWGLREWLTP
jgi:aldehyde:ferredoxin oxidoreductase